MGSPETDQLRSPRVRIPINGPRRAARAVYGWQDVTIPPCVGRCGPSGWPRRRDALAARRDGRPAPWRRVEVATLRQTGNGGAEISAAALFMRTTAGRAQLPLENKHV